MRVRSWSVALGCAALVAASAGGAELASIQKPAFRALAARVFTLDRAQEVRIEGVTFSTRSAWSPARIWLLDGKSRKLVWDAADAELSSGRRDLARFNERVNLPGSGKIRPRQHLPGVERDRHGRDPVALGRGAHLVDARPQRSQGVYTVSICNRGGYRDVIGHIG